jgi:serine/threonine protein kinase
MLAKLKKMFGTNGSAGSKPRSAKVNLSMRFMLVSESGQGSMSKVYRAVDNQTGRTICLKVQIPEKALAAANRAEKEDRPDEGEIGLKLIHPNVVRTYEHGLSTKGEHFIVMEYVDGQSLQFVRENRSARTLEDKLEILAQAAEGLAAVHKAGFIHHDINPRNFLLNREGTVKLIDFGLTVPNTPAFRKPGNRTGALHYMAPELIRREPTDERIDIFAFGALAFEFLTDKLPYDSTNSMTAMLQRLNTEPLDPATANPSLPRAVQKLLRKLIARRKDDRWTSMETLAEALRGVLARAH